MPSTFDRLVAVPIEKQVFAWYVRNCAMSPAAGRLEGTLARLHDKLLEPSCDDDFDFDDEIGRTSPRQRRRRLRAVQSYLAEMTAPSLSEDPPECNIGFACEEFGLDDIDREILLLLVRYGRVIGLEEFADKVLHILHTIPRTLATLVGVEDRAVEARIASNGKLVSAGLISLQSDETAAGGLCGRGGWLKLSPPLRRTLHQRFDSRADWVNAILGQPLTPMLEMDDFSHLGSLRDLAARLIAGAANPAIAARGINLLLHGPVGTGKTEFCKTLAAQAGLTVWSVGEVDQGGAEPLRFERLAALRMAQRLLSGRPGALILFDEAEDVLEQPGSFFGVRLREREGSKVHINRILEQNPVPTVWTCNDVANMDPAVLRRMSLALEVGTPNGPVRRRIWRRVLADSHLQLEDDAVRRLAGRYSAPPGVAANAARVAAIVGGGECEIEQAMMGVLELLHVSPRTDQCDGSEFDPTMVNCSEDLSSLADRLCRADAPRNWSLCLHGAPGTGKSLFARHLADRLGLEVMQRRASDLLSMWVGQSEKQIAEAFASARSRGAMLIIDEADSLLSDRRAAVRSWEVAQVNEMLTWMENHPLPFVCTTNLMERLDHASLRRFTLKLRLDPLDAEQSCRAFEHFFSVRAPRALPDGLTPGDFATVRRKQGLFAAATPALLLHWLEEELDSRGIIPRGMGFLATRTTGRAYAR